ncbi:hypothetical protein Mal4_49590 [Maioricimonas rarisocia]|uniref:Tetratricopeptide repeat protein n=1 Tax=Maioricimonas rarisocia TaxID=2528026 RepID=A0A517ZDP1_9PLAN|nr:hypothetical protein [Maioricimonas rarisocia]QDU40601.1 hypothetical protein Mal4_49590 [Maioricimonas rarisocia]
MSQQAVQHSTSTSRDTRQASRSDQSGKRLQQIHDLLARQKNQEALTLASGSGTDGIPFRNARAVCLMRVGDPQQSVRVLRSLTVSGGVTLRSDSPLECQINFATALAMSGNAQGAVSILDSINRDNDPRVHRLRDAIAHWQTKLTFWEWIQWKGGMAVERPVPLDFEPGELMSVS